MRFQPQSGSTCVWEYQNEATAPPACCQWQDPQRPALLQHRHDKVQQRRRSRILPLEGRPDAEAQPCSNQHSSCDSCHRKAALLLPHQPSCCLSTTRCRTGARTTAHADVLAPRPPSWGVVETYCHQHNSCAALLGLALICQVTMQPGHEQCTPQLLDRLLHERLLPPPLPAPPPPLPNPPARLLTDAML